MAWVFDHLQLIVFVAGTIAYWLNQRAKQKAGEDADYDGDGQPDRPAHPAYGRPVADAHTSDEDERVRRIREEIRRKIAERSGRSGPPPLEPVLGPAEARPAPVSIPPLPVRVEPVPAVVRQPDPVWADADVMDRQRKLAEQMEELAARRAATRSAGGKNKSRPETYEPVAAGPVGRELRSARALRRAFVLREVLDRPVGLR